MSSVGTTTSSAASYATEPQTESPLADQFNWASQEHQNQGQDSDQSESEGESSDLNNLIMLEELNLLNKMNGQSTSPTTRNSGTQTSPTTTGAALTTGNGSINDGRYTISASSTDDGSVSITDNSTGKVMEETWGDPHVKVGDQTIAAFQSGSMNITLPDGTVVSEQAGAQQNGVSHVSNVTVTTQGGQQATITGNNGTIQNGGTVGNVTTGALPPSSSGDINLDLNDNGLFYKNGQQVTSTNGQQTDLNQTAAPNGSASASDLTSQSSIQSLEAQLINKIEQQLEQRIEQQMMQRLMGQMMQQIEGNMLQQLGGQMGMNLNGAD